MSALSYLALFLAVNLPVTTIDGAMERFERSDYAGAAALLDEAAAAAPEAFDLNNLNDLRGRIAAALGDWERAGREFARVGSSSVLHEMALWHRLRVSIHEGDLEAAFALIERLGPGFSSNLMMQVAEEAPEPVRRRIYGMVPTREAEWRLASLENDEAGMWRLLGRRTTDDIALEAALRLDGRAAAPARRLLLAKAFFANRFFERAAAHYGSIVEHPALGAEAHYQLGRTYFQRRRYDEAIGIYRRVAARYPDTDWERDAEFQIAAAYWRKLEFASAAREYLGLIEKYDDREDYHSAVRDLVDLYRAMGEPGVALEWIERALGQGPTAAGRTVLLFTRAKIYFELERWEEAAAIFRQLGRQRRLPASPNGTDLEEVRYFEALSLERLGRRNEARAIWEDLAPQPFDYYGLKAVEKLADRSLPASALQERVSRSLASSSAELCRSAANGGVVDAARRQRLSRTRSYRTAGAPEADLVGELVFLRSWDEAFYWANRSARRWKDEALADLAFLAGDFRRSMLYADRLRPAEERRFLRPNADYPDETRTLVGMLYPVAYGGLVCREAERAGVNPLWLHAIMWQESRYDPGARSEAAARGLMQFIPETASAVANRIGLGLDRLEALYRPEVSIRLGAHHWAELIGELGHAEAALAAYNGGIENVRRWRAKSTGDPELFVSDIGFVQTKEYVRRVFSLYAKYAHLQ